MKFAYFGGEPLAVPVLEELKKADLLPELIICNSDRPVGREQTLTPPPAKVWAEKEGLPTFQPTSYKDQSLFSKLTDSDWDIFVVVAYNFILPKWILDIPKHGVVNVHPSLLPSLRGASPIRTAIKDNLPDEVGVSIMLMDEKMDHGPILDQEQLEISDKNWPIAGPKLDKTLARLGGKLLSEVLPAWINDELSPQEQDHNLATYCGRFQKSDSEIFINPLKLPGGMDAKKAWHTINAFAGIGDTFFTYQGKRVKIKEAERTTSGSLRLLRVIPEGKKEMDFSQYLQSIT
ncbi:methionyl-tRNA formyltransferase [Candidatus Nomurabacteria bacterium]|nr:methionyl-tRNA formyltransferase [Candidatus Nomurabacteria bacterium]